MTTKTRIALLLMLSGAVAAAAADLPDLVLPQGVGVNIHFTRGHEKDLDLIAGAGFKFIRMDFSWGGTERKQGEYTWADYEELTANLERRGLRAIYILDYSNGLYEETITSRDPVSGRETRAVASPQHPESVAAFARWAGAAARHFKGRRIIWEIWNEPNIGFWKPKPDVRQYTALALAVCKAIREVDPQATIVGPATSEVPLKFLGDFFQAGALVHLDAVSVHPYRSYSKPPETAVKEYEELRALIGRHRPPAKTSMPILSGEWGYATHAKGVSLETQAAFLVRQQLVNLWQGVPLSIWYDWKNDGQDPNYNEHNFGTVYSDLKPKPAYTAVQILTRALGGCRIARRLPLSRTDDFVLLCVDRDGHQRLAAWTSGDAHTITLELEQNSAADVVETDGLGGPQSPRLQQGKLSLALGALPRYITLKRPERTLSAAAAWRLVDELGIKAEAGTRSGFQAWLRFSNPFPERLIASVRVRGPVELAAGPAATFTISPGLATTQELAGTFHQRQPPTLDLAIEVELSLQSDGKGVERLGVFTEHRRVAIDNPLSLSLAPVAGGYQVRVESPSGAPFAGRLLGLGDPTPVKLDARSEAVVRIKSGKDAQEAVAVRLEDSAGILVAALPARRFLPLELGALRAALDGDAKVTASAGLAATNAPTDGGEVATRATRLDYDFASGWRFVRCVPVVSKPIQINGRPSQLGVWVYGDESGNVLRMRVTDDGGQTFQPNGPAIDWTGWRWIAFDLGDLKDAGHWGGANDGVVKGGLRLDCPLLLDSGSRKTAGSIYFAGLTLIY